LPATLTLVTAFLSLFEPFCNVLGVRSCAIVYRCPITRHERFPWVGRAPVSYDWGGGTLKALFVGLCVLTLATQATAEAKGKSGERAAKPPHAAKMEQRSLSLTQRLEHKLDVARRQRSTIRFFGKHRWLLASADHRLTARTALRRAARRLERVTRNIAAIRRVLRRREARRSAATPKVAICKVFGRYCRQALDVAWCESRHRTTAQNGQYLGLFQMGSSERQLFGHGHSARAQAVAAHRYFVLSGRDWSPWSCKPRYTY
jgi:hypothetical protein